MPKHQPHPDPQALAETEEALASFSLADLPVEDEPCRAFEDLKPTAETLTARLMGQVVYQINRRIRELDAREPQGMSRAALAERMGVSKSQVSRLLGAQSNTTLLTVAKAALALGLSEAVLKLIPAEAAPHQKDEVKAFVESEARWWPLTDRREAGSAPVLSIRRPSVASAIEVAADVAANDYSYAYATTS